MLKYETSKLTEAIDNYFDNVLNEADPAVNIIGNDDNELDGIKNNLEHFISTAFNDHAEDIANVDISYSGKTAVLEISLKDSSDISTLQSFYESKFELQGSESGDFYVASTDSVDSEGKIILHLELKHGDSSLDGEDNEDKNGSYTFDDLYEICLGTDASIVLEDIENSLHTDELVDLVNSGMFVDNDDIIEFITFDDEVQALRDDEQEYNSTDANESENLQEDDDKLKQVIKNAKDQAKIEGYDQYIYQDKDGSYSFSRVDDSNYHNGETYIGKVSVEVNNGTKSYKVYLEKETINEDDKSNNIRLEGDSSNSKTHTWEVLYNRSAIERCSMPNSRKTIKGTCNDLMKFLDDQYVEGCYNDDGKYATLSEWKENQEWADPGGSTAVLEIRCDGKIVFEDHSYDIEDFDYDDDDLDENETLTEQVVPASELGFKHQELAKIEDEVALISKLKGEDPGNELYTKLLDCFDKAISTLKDAIGEEPVGTVVGNDEVSITTDSEAKLGGSEDDESTSDLDREDIGSDTDVEDNVPHEDNREDQGEEI